MGFSEASKAFRKSSTQQNESVFVKQLNPAANHSVICAIDFGTSGIGFSFAFTKPNEELDPKSEVFPNKPWPLTDSFKTSTSIILNKQNDFQAFGKQATQFITNLRKYEQTRPDYRYFHNFKMQLSLPNLNNGTMLCDELTKEEVPAVTVIGLCLKKVKEAFLEQIRLLGNGNFDKSNVLWVVTVPAIWKDDAKKIMREASVIGGLIGFINSDSLLLVLEPEAASMWCLINKHIEVQRNDVFIVVDCGGGTIDVTVHKVKDSQTSIVSEVFPVSGGDWGSEGIDKNFFYLLEEIMGTEKYTELLGSKGILLLREEWEKRKLACTEADETSIPLPAFFSKGNYAVEFENALDSYCRRKKVTISVDSNNLVLSKAVIKQLFDPVIEKIINHIDKILTNSRIKATTLIIVGNFANCELLQREFLKKGRETNVKVIVPPNPGVCVANGAVLIAHRPNVISDHLSRFAYGSAINQTYDAVMHPDSEYQITSISKQSGLKEVVGCMDWFIGVDEVMPYGKTITRIYMPTDFGQTKMEVRFYETTERNIIYQNHPLCRYIGKIVTKDLVYEEIRQKGVKYHILFGASEIHVRSEDPKGKFHETKIEYK
ncbi:hypothetical protein HK096_009536 [Nowakowskiella sp. JEL0078]|nr:hypothetical protein HK096_009536 [Nowakowskiella sp. JEL0078]